ncbi:MAG: protein translocase subunit SecF, partial [Planctomycetota bacterium]
ALTADEAGGYEDAASLLTIVGTDGSGVGKAESAVRSFSKLTVTADPIVTAENFGKALESVRARFAAEPVFDEVNSFDTAVAGEMQVSAITAILASLVAIVGYLWLRFESVTFGLAAVVALVHDVLIVLGLLGLAATAAAGGLTVLGLEEFKINLPIIAAFLTIIGYSLNDTIVVFDRVREVKGRSSKLTADIVDRSLNQTLARTLLTSVTTFLVVIILYAFGGEGIHGFAFCLVCGVLVGTYSSLFVASPALLWLSGRELKVPTPELIDKTATPAA